MHALGIGDRGQTRRTGPIGFAKLEKSVKLNILDIPTVVIYRTPKFFFPTSFQNGEVPYLALGNNVSSFHLNGLIFCKIKL